LKGQASRRDSLRQSQTATRAFADELEPAIAEVLSQGDFILGRHVARFEEAFASYCGANYGLGVNSGTSALHLAFSLRSWTR